MSDPTAGPDAVITAIEAAVLPETDDTPIAIGSIEPETLDFAPVSTISETVSVPTTEVDLAFGDHGKIYPTLPNADAFFRQLGEWLEDLRA